MTKRPTTCPCDSGARYAACCGPAHRGAREPADAVALMRSRYSAFAVGDADYLWRTLHEDHVDRSVPRVELLRAPRDVCRRRRFLGLTILDHAEPDADGVARVLFAARVFEAGRDVSIVEASMFRHDGTGWRYLDGDLEDAPGAAVRSWTLATFAARG